MTMAAKEMRRQQGVGINKGAMYGTEDVLPSDVDHDEGLIFSDSEPHSTTH